MNAPLKADVTAADRLLRAAVRRAVHIYRSPNWAWAADEKDRRFVENMLATATHAADLLLADDDQPAKKAAKRAPKKAS